MAGMLTHLPRATVEMKSWMSGSKGDLRKNRILVEAEFLCDGRQFLEGRINAWDESDPFDGDPVRSILTGAGLALPQKFGGTSPQRALNPVSEPCNYSKVCLALRTRHGAQVLAPPILAGWNFFLCPHELSANYSRTSSKLQKNRHD